MSTLFWMVYSSLQRMLYVLLQASRTSDSTCFSTTNLICFSKASRCCRAEKNFSFPFNGTMNTEQSLCQDTQPRLHCSCAKQRPSTGLNSHISEQPHFLPKAQYLFHSACAVDFQVKVLRDLQEVCNLLGISRILEHHGSKTSKRKVKINSCTTEWES